MSATCVLPREVPADSKQVIPEGATPRGVATDDVRITTAPPSSTTTTDDHAFLAWHEHFTKSPRFERPFVTQTAKGKQVAYFMRTKRPAYVEDWLRMDNERMRCRACATSAANLLSLVGPDNVPFCTPPSDDVRTQAAFKDIETYCTNPSNAQRSVCTDRVYVVTTDIITEDGTNPVFDHYAARTLECTAPELNQAHINRVLHMYIPIVMRMFKTQGVPGIRDSIAHLEVAMEKVAFAKTKLAYGIQWFKDHIIEDFNHKVVRVQLEHVVNAIITVLPTSTTVDEIPIIHQLNKTTFPLLVSCDGVESLIGLMRAQFDVYTYQKPTAEPSTGNIQIGMKKLGDFTNTIMTLEQADAHGMVRCPDGTPITQSSMGILAAQLAAKKQATQSARPKSAAGFAARAGDLAPTTLAQLMTSMPSNLYISTKNIAKLLLIETTLKEEARCVPFFHGVVNVNDDLFTPRVYRQVIGIIKFGGIGASPVRFGIILKDEQAVCSRNSCCFASFLSVSYNRECRDAFELLNTELPLRGLTGPNLACGLYSSVCDNETKLITPLTFRIGTTGTPFSIAKSA